METPAPLISVSGAAAPEGGTACWIEGSGGARLRAALFERPQARGTVVLSPGRTEPIEKYFEVIGELRARGFVVLTHDWRGQGLSQRALPDRLRGHVEAAEAYAADYRLLLDAYAGRLPGPWISLAHSMGAALVLSALVAGEDRLKAALLTAPMLGVATGPAPAWFARLVSEAMVRIGQGGGYALAPSDPALARFEGNPLTHDRGRYERYQAQLRACPDLSLGSPTWGWLKAALSITAALGRPGALEALRLPVAMVAAGEERLVLNAVSRAAARRLADGSYAEIPGARHELLMETDEIRAQVWAAFDALAARVTSPSA